MADPSEPSERFFINSGTNCDIQTPKQNPTKSPFLVISQKPNHGRTKQNNDTAFGIVPGAPLTPPL